MPKERSRPAYLTQKRVRFEVKKQGAKRAVCAERIGEANENIIIINKK